LAIRGEVAQLDTARLNRSTHPPIALSLDRSIQQLDIRSLIRPPHFVSGEFNDDLDE
jgi:hypothetical protein